MERFYEKIEKKAVNEIRKQYRQVLKNIKTELLKLEEQGVLNGAEIVKYGRLKKLEQAVIKEASAVTKANNKIVKNELMEVYEETYYRTGFTLETEVQAKLGYKAINDKLLGAALINQYDLIGWENRMKNNGALMVRQIISKVSEGIVQGRPYREIARDVTERVDISSREAIVIARTEGGRVYSRASLDSMMVAESAGVIIAKKWVSTLDERTRPTHQQADGQEVPIDGEFEVGGVKMIAPRLSGVASEDIQCFAGDTFVAIPTKLEKGYKRYYEGQLISIETAGGIKLTGTPNHPILTDKGWVPLKLLQAGDNVICGSLGENTVSPDPNIKNKPPVISKVFDFINISYPTQRASGVVEQFHGDGFNCEVDVVNVFSELGDEVDVSFSKPSMKNMFFTTNFRKALLNSFSSFNFAGNWSCRTTPRVVSFFSKGFSFLKSALGHSKIHGLASISRNNSKASEPVGDCPPATVENFSQLLYGKAGMVKIDNVVSVDIKPFIGHVYNLQTKNSFYVASNNIVSEGEQKDNGIIVHNCRCNFIEIVKGFEPKFRRVRGEGVIPYKTYEEWKKNRIG